VTYWVRTWTTSTRRTLRCSPDGAVVAAAVMADASEPMASPMVLPPPSAPVAVCRRLVAHRYSGGQLRHWRGGFWHWTGPCWVELEERAIRSDAYAFTEHANYINSKGELVPWAPTRHKIANLLDALAALVHLPESAASPSWIDGDSGPKPGQIVACSNGLLDVTTRALLPHRSTYFNQVAVPFAYDPGSAEPVRWLGFLEQLWPDDADAISALQEFVGYAIAGRIDLHKILLLIGPTRAGKGVIARVIKGLIGEGNAAGPTLASLGTNFGLSPLIGKPLAIVSDARLGGPNTHQIVERLLSVSGEDMLTIDRKYREPWTGTLNTRFLVISNELPRFGDASGAIANRMIVLTLKASFLGKENPGLTRELFEELPGILGWALDGLERLTGNSRFTEPASSADAVLSLQDLASPVSAFVRDNCTVSAEKEVAVNTLFTAWKSWCLDNGRDRAGTVQTFGRDLRAVIPGLQSVRPRDGDNRERRYAGIGLANPNNNGSDRGPERTNAAVHDGPQPTPLLPRHEIEVRR
jgi:putative DNA primase/helicase